MALSDTAGPATVFDDLTVNGTLTLDSLAGLGVHPGTIFYVYSGAAGDASGNNWTNACLTIDAAVNLCTASKGDIILVHPFHAENLAADSAVDIDVIGVQVIGVRYGRQMPTLTVTAAAGDLKLAAAGVTIKNLRFLGGIDEISGCIEVAAADCSVIDCEYRDVTGQATDVIMVVASSDRCVIDGFTCFGAAAAGGNSAIAVNAADDLEIKNCYIYGNFAVGGIDFRTAASARMNIHDCKIWSANAAVIAIVDTITASTGFIGPNLQIMLLTNGANITEAITAATCQMIDPIYICNLAGEKAMLTNITASTD